MSYLFCFLLILWCMVFPVLLVHADERPVINEFLVHPSTGDKEWVEFYVPDGQDIVNYWIDDDTDFASDTGSSSKKQITSVTAGSDSRHVVFQLTSSMFNNGGDTVALFAPDGTLVDQYIYTDDPGTDIAIGRSPDATGGFQILSYATRGSPNSTPKPPDTPIPAPTDKPTKEPKPTETPKPAKPTAAVQTTTNTTKTFAGIDTVSKIKNSIISITPVASTAAGPTSILGMSTKSAEKRSFTLPKKQILIKGTSNSMPRIIAVSIGGVLLIGCGILVYFKKQGMWPWKREP